MKKIFLFALVVTFANLTAQVKQIKFKEEYKHPATSLVFPNMFSGYKIDEVNAFDKKKRNICVDYKSQQADDKTIITIYVYPAGDGVEGRLRQEFLMNQTAINYRSKSERSFAPFSLIRFDDTYTVNGLLTTFTEDDASQGLISVYECGTWFLKVRITSNQLDKPKMVAVEKQIVSSLKPASLTALHPLQFPGKFSIGNAAYKDTLLLASSLGYALRKMSWARQNVAEKECRSGFPDLYLTMHVEAVSFFANLEFEADKKYGRKPATDKYLADLRKLIKDGYLEEYLVENYNGIFIIPETTVLDNKGFEAWKTANPVPEFIFSKLSADLYNE